MKLHKFLIIALITNVAAEINGTQKCCQNERNLLIKTRCAPDNSGKKPLVILQCDEKYILNPHDLEEDHYVVETNGTLYITDMDSYLLPNEYCLVNLYDEEINETNEVAIVCFPDNEPEIAKVSFDVKAILLFISIVFLLLTLYIYFRLPELRETQDKVTICTLICLTAFLLFLGSMQLYSPYSSKYDICLMLAFPTYFFTMGYFAWLNCVIANVWKAVVLRRWKINESSWYVCNHLYGWTIPCVLTSIVYAKHIIKPSLGITSCWFHQNRDQWLLVYTPISIMLTLNIVLCIWSSLYLVNTDYTPDTLKALRYKCILYLKMFLLGGFTWIFEVLSYTFNDHSPSAWLWMIIDSLNCLHGVLVFCVLILWRQRIRKELANRRILCFTCPSKWANIDDEEQVCLENEGKAKYDLIIKALK